LIDPDWPGGFWVGRSTESRKFSLMHCFRRRPFGEQPVPRYPWRSLRHPLSRDPRWQALGIPWRLLTQDIATAR